MSGPRLMAAVLVVLALTGCTRPDQRDPGADGSGVPSNGGSRQSPEQSTAERLQQQLLQGEEAPAPVTTVRGALSGVQSDTGSSPVEVDILSVKAGPETTLLRWRLRSGTGEPVRVFTFSLAESTLSDTRNVTLVDASGGKRLQPFTFTQQRNDDDTGCVCSRLPDDVGAEGVLMYALYPPLPADTTTVDVLIPGIAPAEKVPVTR